MVAVTAVITIAIVMTQIQEHWERTGKGEGDRGRGGGERERGEGEGGEGEHLLALISNKLKYRLTLVIRSYDSNSQVRSSLCQQVCGSIGISVVGRCIHHRKKEEKILSPWQ